MGSPASWPPQMHLGERLRLLYDEEARYHGIAPSAASASKYIAISRMCYIFQGQYKCAEVCKGPMSVHHTNIGTLRSKSRRRNCSAGVP
eukprot:6174480-Pleurochrysis_carterae.AAC.5